MEKLQIFEKDEHGNALILRGENARMVDVLLKVKAKKIAMRIGVLDRLNNDFYCDRSTTAHLHVMSDSFGFNYKLLTNPVLNIQHVNVRVDKQDYYRIPVSDIVRLGKFQQYSKQGFELQKFITRSMLEQYKLKRP